jgi:hypothetical protein
MARVWRLLVTQANARLAIYIYREARPRRHRPTSLVQIEDIADQFGFVANALGMPAPAG